MTTRGLTAALQPGQHYAGFDEDGAPVPCLGGPVGHSVAEFADPHKYCFFPCESCGALDSKHYNEACHVLCTCEECV